DLALALFPAFTDSAADRVLEAPAKRGGAACDPAGVAEHDEVALRAPARCGARAAARAHEAHDHRRRRVCGAALSAPDPAARADRPLRRPAHADTWAREPEVTSPSSRRGFAPSGEAIPRDP